MYSHVNHIVLYRPGCLNVPLTGCSGRWSGLVPSWSHSIIIIIFRGASLLISSLAPPLPLKTIYGLFLFWLLADLFRVVLGDSSAFTSWLQILGTFYKLSFVVDLAQNLFFHSLWAGNDRSEGSDKDLWSWSNGQQVDCDGQSERQCSALRMMMMISLWLNNTRTIVVIGWFCCLLCTFTDNDHSSLPITICALFDSVYHYVLQCFILSFTHCLSLGSIMCNYVLSGRRSIKLASKCNSTITFRRVVLTLCDVAHQRESLYGWRLRAIGCNCELILLLCKQLMHSSLCVLWAGQATDVGRLELVFVLHSTTTSYSTSTGTAAAY